MKWVFIFSKLLSNTFLNLTRITRDTITSVHKLFLSDFNKILILDGFQKK